MRAVHGKRDGKANRPFCSRVMKERRVVMKERAIPGPCNCCPRIQYYSMGLAIWTDCIPKRDIYIYIYIHIYKHTISTQYSAITCLALRRSAITGSRCSCRYLSSPTHWQPTSWCWQRTLRLFTCRCRCLFKRASVRKSCSQHSGHPDLPLARRRPRHV